MTKYITHVYFGDHANHPIILNYLDDTEIQANVIDAPKYSGSRTSRIFSLICSLVKLEKSKRYIFHTHDLLSFYLTRFMYPSKKVIFDSHEVYCSYFKYPLKHIVRVLEELATVLASSKVYPSPERRDLYFFSIRTVIVENLFNPPADLFSIKTLRRDINSFVYAGLLSHQRCIEELVYIFKKIPSIKLTIFGAPNEYMNRLLDSGLPPNVEYAGMLSHKCLVRKLPEFAASFALYKPLDLNNQYPAPTKIFENEYSGISTIVLNSDYLGRLVREGRLKNTSVLERLDVPALKKIIASRFLEKSQPNTCSGILWNSQRSSIHELYFSR